MLKNGLKRRIMVCFLSLIVLLVIYLVPSNTSDSISYDDSNKIIDKVYLRSDDVLVLCNIIGSSNDILDKIKDIINDLTIDSNKSKYINSNFKALIPKGTKLLDVSIDNGIVKLNFDDKFISNKDNLKKIIESIVFSLTEIDDVKGVMLFVNDERLVKLDKENIMIPSVIDRSFGINKVYDIDKLENVFSSILYYYKRIDAVNYLVPVTLFSNNDINKVDVIIEELSSAPIYYSDLMSFLSSNAKLLDYEIMENSIKLNFSNYLLDDFFDDSLIEEVKYAISLSLKSTLGIEDISYFVLKNEV